MRYGRFHLCSKKGICTFYLKKIHAQKTFQKKGISWSNFPLHVSWIWHTKYLAPFYYSLIWFLLTRNWTKSFILNQEAARRFWLKASIVYLVINHSFYFLPCVVFLLRWHYDVIYWNSCIIHYKTVWLTLRRFCLRPRGVLG